MRHEIIKILEFSCRKSMIFMVFRDLQKLDDLIDLKIPRLGFVEDESLQLAARIGRQVIFLYSPSKEPLDALEAG